MIENDKVPVLNVDGETLFDPDELKRYYNEMTSKEEIDDREIMDYLFKECTEVGKRIKKQGPKVGARGHHYSGLMIQFAVMLRSKCSANLYDFFAEFSICLRIRLYASIRAQTLRAPTE